MSIHKAQFINETDLPIEVWGLVQVMPGLNKLDPIIVMPKEECTIISITGEWFLCSHTNDLKYKEMWDKIESNYNLGKFRNSPCIRGDYSWMDTDNFTVTFSQNVFKFNYADKN